MNQTRFTMQYTVTNDRPFVLPPELKVDGLKTSTRSYTTPSWSGTSYITVVTATSPTLADGVHTASVRVRDGAGNHYLTWTFSTGTPPTIANPLPAPNSVVAQTTPVISAGVSDGAGIANTSMTINGLAVPTSYVGGVLSANLPAPLADFEKYLVVVSATDTTGLSTTYAWSFDIQSVPKMAAPAGVECIDCHASYPAAHPVDNCAACHGDGSPIGRGYTDPAQSHAPGTYCSNCHGNLTTCTDCHGRTFTTVPVQHDLVRDTYHASADFACDPCHYQRLTIEHAQHLDDASQPYTCETCHASTDAGVMAAIEAGDTRCTSCHGAGHQTIHETTVAAECAACHQPNLVDEHFARSLTCDTCHNSADALVVAAIAAGDKSCTACHGATDHMVVHESAITAPCSDCHEVNLVSEHVTAQGLTCDTCHASANAAVQQAIDTGTTECSACHGATSHLEVHASAVSAPCSDCHVSNVVTEHVDVRGLTCATCHSSTDPAVTAAIAANDTSCAACHGTVDHVDLHVSTVDAPCADCHVNNVITEHVDVRGLTCATCHASTDPAVSAAIAANDTSCAACHGATSHTDLHPSTVAPDCASCHQSNLVTEHVDGRGLTCATCHSSTDPTVTGAIAANDTACATCHGTVDHVDIHPSPVGADCSSCHEANLVTEHVTEQGLTCATCHASTDPTVTAAIAANDTTCAACHGATDHLSFHATTVAAPCSDCHVNNVVTEHVDVRGLTCATCHSSTDPAVTAAIAANDTSCAACHGTVDHAAFHPSTLSADCAACHQSNLVTEHVDGQALTCATCHSSTDPAVSGAIAANDTACASCHPGAGDHLVVHASDIGSCADCHNGNVVTEHQSQGFTCATCHSSTDPTVMAAIAANDLRCLTCHDFSSHPYTPTQHTATVSAVTVSGSMSPYTFASGSTMTYSGQTCGQCHLMDLYAEHTKPSSNVAANQCAACHSTPRDTLGSWNKTCQQGGCHATIHAGMTTKHAQTYGNSTTTGCGQGAGECHVDYWPVGDLAAIHNYVWEDWTAFADISAARNGCALCHKSNTSVPAVPTGCTSCHTVRHGEAATP